MTVVMTKCYIVLACEDKLLHDTYFEDNVLHLIYL